MQIKKGIFIGLGTLTLALGFYMMRNVPVGQICLGVVWVCHLVYFLLFVNTIRAA